MDCMCSLCFLWYTGMGPQQSEIHRSEDTPRPGLQVAELEELVQDATSEGPPENERMEKKRWAGRGPKAAQLVESRLIQHVTDSGLTRALLEISREREPTGCQGWVWAWGVVVKGVFLSGMARMFFSGLH